MRVRWRLGGGLKMGGVWSEGKGGGREGRAEGNVWREHVEEGIVERNVERMRVTKFED